MTRKGTPVAKISSPSLSGVYSRNHLFRMIDSRRKRHVIWTCGPPGAGKTTLVAIYLLSTFTRRYFRELYGRGKTPSVMVLDDYHLRKWPGHGQRYDGDHRKGCANVGGKCCMVNSGNIWGKCLGS